MENQLDSVAEKPIRFLRLQGLTYHWSKHNEHSRNIFSVHGFCSLSVNMQTFCLQMYHRECNSNSKMSAYSIC